MMKIKWLGQAGYLLDVDGTIICIDPYLSNIVFDVEKMPRMIEPPVSPKELYCHLYISTHDHLDHLDPLTITEMDKENVIFAGPSSCIAHFLQLGIDSEQLRLFDRGQEIQINGITLKSVFADHTDDSIGVAIVYQDKCMYFVGDSLFHEKLGEELERVDVLFTCINGRLGNMTDMQAVKLAEKLHPRLAVPNHYGMFAANTVSPMEFVKAVKALGIEVYTAEPGKEFSLDEIGLM